MLRPGTKCKKKAFTLTESLVVVAIIWILTSILFPVFARARENARKASSAGTISGSTNTYVYNFCGTVYGVKGNGFGWHPAKPCTPNGTATVLNPVTESFVQEAPNTFLVTDPPSNGYASGSIYDYGGINGLQYLPVLHGGQAYSKDLVTVTDFSDGGNYLFADRHVKFLKASVSLKSSMWNVDKTD